MAAPRLRATDSGQVYNIDLPDLRVTRDEAFERKKEIDYSTFR